MRIKHVIYTCVDELIGLLGNKVTYHHQRILTIGGMITVQLVCSLTRFRTKNVVI